MKILLTNDDGIDSPSLAALSKWAEKLGEITVIAPKVEQSGKSHAIDFHREIEIKKQEIYGGKEAYSVDSTPADCVRFGVLGLKEKFDLVLSGINNGYNLGCDIVYSGTIGAVFEAARLEIPGIALSTYFGPFEGAAASLDRILDFFKKHRLMELCSHYNVNIPPENDGFRITRQGGIYYTDEFIDQGNGMFKQVGSQMRYDSLDPDCDIAAIGEGCISVTPLLFDRTNTSVFEKLKEQV